MPRGAALEEPAYAGQAGKKIILGSNMSVTGLYRVVLRIQFLTTFCALRRGFFRFLFQLGRNAHVQLSSQQRAGFSQGWTFGLTAFV